MWVYTLRWTFRCKALCFLALPLHSDLPNNRAANLNDFWNFFLLNIFFHLRNDLVMRKSTPKAKTDFLSNK